jgi:hypothetical protein
MNKEEIMEDIIETYKTKFDRIFAGENPNSVFNRRDFDENGNMVKVPVDKEYLLRAARAVFGSSSEEIIKKVEELTF